MHFVRLRYGSQLLERGPRLPCMQASTGSFEGPEKQQKQGRGASTDRQIETEESCARGVGPMATSVARRKERARARERERGKPRASKRETGSGKVGSITKSCAHGVAPEAGNLSRGAVNSRAL